MREVLDSGIKAQNLCHRLEPPPRTLSLPPGAFPPQSHPHECTANRGRVVAASSPACPDSRASSAEQEWLFCSLGKPRSWGPCGDGVLSTLIPPYQSIFRHTQDHIVQHGSTAEVLSYRQAAQTVAGVVEVPRPARTGRF